MIYVHDKHVHQPPGAWLLETSSNDPVSVLRCTVDDGGLLLAEGLSPTILSNVGNTRRPTGSSKYFGMFWPVSPDGKPQRAVPSLHWQNDDPNLRVFQGYNEAAFRGKIDDASIIGVHFVAAVDAHGRPIKQAVQVRHGKSWLFQGGQIENGWFDLGQQKVEGQGYVKTQRVGLINFDSWKFTRWTAAHKLFELHPGVSKIVYAGDCRDPDGKRIK